jgi:hypothetical protein
MKTLIQDVNGDKLKVREYAVDLKTGDDVVWVNKPAKVQKVYYDVATDTRIVILDLDVKPEEIKE